MEDLRKQLSDIQKDINEIKLIQTAMEVDLRHHIKRSDKHERLLMAIIFTSLMAGGASAKYLFPLLGKIF
jgi:hypothetical protein